MTIKNASTFIGALFLVQLITYFIGNQVLLQSIISSHDLLFYQDHSNTLIVSVILELICAISVVGISVIFYPILKQFSQRIALWYVGFRLLEFSIIAFSKLKILTLLRLSQEYKLFSPQDNSNFQLLRKLLLAEHNLAILMTLLIFSIGAIFFYYLLFKSLIIPGFISLWGLIGAALVLVAAILQLFDINTPFFLFIPMGLNELFIGIWLIVKGFNKLPAT